MPARVGNCAMGEMLAVLLARDMADGEKTIVGTNSDIQVAACNLARATHAPQLWWVSGPGGMTNPTEGVIRPAADAENIAVSSMKTRAVRDGDSWVLNGQKIYITFAPVADYILVFARTSPGKGANGISAFIVDTKTPGFSCGPLDRKMGIRGVPNSPIYLEDVRVAAENMIGPEGKAFKTCMRILDLNRPTIGAAAVGVAQGAIDQATAYAKQRVQFNQPISEFQGIQFMLADMQMQTEAARCLLYDCTHMADREDWDGFSAKAAMVKCFGSDVAMKVTTDAVQIFGGAGYMRDFPVERMMRDAKINQIFEGTNQIQRLVIARDMLKD